MRRIWGVRIVFALLLLLLPIQLLGLKFVGAEPYPALFMPGFGSVPQRGDEVTVRQTVVTAVSSAGDHVTVDYVRLMPNQTKLAESIANDFFANHDRVEEAAADGWLEQRLSRLYAGKTFSKVSVQTSILLIDLETGEKRDTGIESYSVELTGDAS